MTFLRPGGVGRVVSFLAFAALLCSGTARADLSAVEGLTAPIVRIQIPTQANLIVRTWDRRQVQVEGDATTFTVTRSANYVPASMPAFIRAGETKGPNGPIVLPAESFVVTSISPGPHAVVLIRAQAGHPVGPITVMIPSQTALVQANVGRGSLALEGYQNGTFILHLNNGTATVDGVSGDGFVQVMHGQLFAADSNFNRLRARSAVGHQVFERCDVKQIEASVVNGSIVFDNGHFEQGLARFDVTTGNVALGTAAPAQLNAHVAGGHVTTLFDRRVQVDGRDTDSVATIEGGGPVVTATSGNGSVLLYDGTLRNKTRIPAEWQPAKKALRRDNDAFPSQQPPPASGNNNQPQAITRPEPQQQPQPRNRPPPPPRPKGRLRAAFLR